MAYTKTQLKEAYCEREGYNSEKHGTVAEFLTSEEAKYQEAYDKEVASIPTPRQRMTEIARNYLLAQEREANKDVEL